MKTFAMTGAVLCLAAATPAFAQDDTARRQATEIAARVPLEKAMKSAPYSAETIVESSQALADGNRISRKTTGRVYRDSEGRTRREEDAPITIRTASGVVTNQHTTISIVDPVAGFSYSLDPENKIAWRTPMGVGGSIMGKLEAQQTVARKVQEESVNAAGQPVVTMRSVPLSEEEKQKVEAARAGGGGAVMRARGAAVTPDVPLEHKVLDGLAVEGRTTRSVIPAGTIGNDQPITITNEEWRSTDLNVLVLTRHSDPRTGESNYRLQNIVRAEPDPSLFIVPADYTVKDTGIRRMLEASRKQP